MIDSPEALLQELRARGLVAEGLAAAEPARQDADRPWYVSLLLGTAGWVAGIFVLIIAFMLFKFDSGASAFVIGIVLMAAAWGLFKADREGVFVAQLALALSIAGQFAALFGLGDTLLKGMREIAGLALMALVMQAALVIVMPNALHRTMSAFFACTAWAVLVRYGLWDTPDWNLSSNARRVPPVELALGGWALAWIPVAGLLYVLIRREAEWMARGWQAIVRPATVGLVVGLAVTTLISQPFESFSWIDRNADRGGLAIWPLLSALAAIGALAAAFALGRRGLAAVCVIAALLHISHFYYAIGTTLLAKAMMMIALGVLFVGMARRLRAP